MYSVTNEQLAAAQVAVSADPMNAALHSELGMAYFFQDRYYEAMAQFYQALVIDPNQIDAHNGIGRVHYHIGPPEAAIASYSKTLELDPTYIPGYWGLGILYFAKLGEYDKAIEVFERGLEQNPAEVGFYGGIGHGYARSGRFEQALQAYQQQIQHDPEHAGELDVAIVYMHQGRFVDALAAIKRAIDNNPTPAWQYRILGFIHHMLGNYQDAVAPAEQAVERDPDDYENRGGLARAYRAVGREMEALEQEQAGYQLAKAADEYGKACLEATLGNLDKAVELLEIGLAKKQLTQGWARIDPEFVFLQNHPRYRALVMG
jgi:tetratricopeptide (TPR) repeat protein